VGAELFQAEGQTDVTNMTKLETAFAIILRRRLKMENSLILNHYKTFST